MGNGREVLATALRSLIKQSGWTGYKVARVARVSRQSVYRFLKGSQMIDLPTADKLMDALKATCELKREPQT